MVNPAELLWNDTSVYRCRLEKSAAALIAVHRSLVTADLGVLEAHEFQEFYKSLSNIDSDVFTQVWSDPVAYFWVRRAVHLLAGCRGTPVGDLEKTYCDDVGATDPLDATRIHLADFKRFIVAAAVISGRNLSFDRPYETSLPLSLPGTELILEGKGRATVHGLVDGELEVSHEGALKRLGVRDAANASGLSLTPCPIVAVAGFRLALNAPLFNLPGLGLGGGWIEFSLRFQQQHLELVAEALDAVACFQPSTYTQFSEALKAVALKSSREGSFGSLSSSELPGVFICSVPCDPYELAATFIHEFHHNRLFYLEECGPFFDLAGEDAIEGPNHYSPWRDTPRPLHGLFHAIYVYLPVFRFWSALFRENQLDGIQLAYSIDQLGRIPFQLRIGVNQLRRHAKFTPFGSMLFEQMAAETAEAETEARSLGISLDMPAVSLRATGVFRPVVSAGEARALTIGETLRDHLENRDLRSECVEERLLLAPRAFSSIR